MPSKILVEQIAHTNDTSAIDIDSSGNMVLQKELKFGATGAIKNSAGNAILQESGGNVTLSNVRLPASGGISDSSGNAILTESGGVVTVGENVVGGVPAGAIMSFAMASSPSGWLVCDGSALSRTTYASLFTAIGTTWGVGDGSTTFNLPDLRGEFLRGFDNGAGNDPDAGSRTGGDAVGSSQGDAIRNITGSVNVAYGNGHSYSFSGAFDRTTSHTGDPGVSGYTGSDFDFDASRVVPTGSDNRPRNIAVQYCIKY